VRLLASTRLADIATDLDWPIMLYQKLLYRRTQDIVSLKLLGLTMDIKVNFKQGRMLMNLDFDS
jgi:hypothetical protein